MFILKAFVKLAAGAGPWVATAGSIGVVCLWVSVDQIAERPANGPILKLNRSTLQWSVPNVPVDLLSDTEALTPIRSRHPGWNVYPPNMPPMMPDPTVYLALEAIESALDNLVPPHEPALSAELPAPLARRPATPAQTRAQDPVAPAPSLAPSTQADAAPTTPSPQVVTAPSGFGSAQGPGAPRPAHLAAFRPIDVAPVIVPLEIPPLPGLISDPVPPGAVYAPLEIVLDNAPSTVPEPSSLALLTGLGIALPALQRTNWWKPGWRRGRRQQR